MNWSIQYRPHTFDDVAGNVKVVQELKKRFIDNNIPKVVMFSGYTGSGKCVTGDTLLLTENGFQYINSFSLDKKGFYPLEIELFTKNKYKKTSNFFEEKTHNTVLIKTKFGFEIEGTPEHKLYVLDKNMNYKFKKLEEINESDVICLLQNSNIFSKKDNEINFNPIKKGKNHCTKEVVLPKVMTKNLARFLGYYIGNGNIGNNYIAISSKNIKIQEDIKIILKDFNLEIGKIYCEKDFNINSVIFKDFIEYLIGNQIKEKTTARYKNVPEFVLKGTKEIQIEFLKGLIDCDSWGNNNIIEYYTASKQLCSEVQLMLLNLGIFSYKKEKYLEKYNHVYYTLCITSEDLDRYKDIIKYESLKYDFIKSNKKRNTNIKIIPYLKDYLENELIGWKNLVKIDKSGRIKNVSFLNKKSFLKHVASHGEITYEYLKNIKNVLEKNVDLDLNNIIKNMLEKIMIILNNNFIYDEIIDKNNITDEKLVYDFVVPEFHNFYSNGMISHNTTLQYIYIKSLLCENPKNGNCCNECKTCKAIDADSPLEQLTTYNGSNIGVDEMRQLQERASRKILGLKNIKIFQIDEMQEISTSKAQKNILKLLEKTSDNTHFVLGTMNKTKIDAAILNRAIVYNLSLEISDIRNYLVNIIKKENIVVTPELAKMVIAITNNCNSSMRTAISYLERVVYSEITTEEELYKELGIMSEESINNFINGLLKGDIQIIKIKPDQNLLEQIKTKLVWLFEYYNGLELSQWQKGQLNGIEKTSVNKIEIILSTLQELMLLPYLSPAIIEFQLVRCIMKVKELNESIEKLKPTRGR
jgi:DNA polymerase III delta prime subunit